MAQEISHSRARDECSRCCCCRSQFYDRQKPFRIYHGIANSTRQSQHRSPLAIAQAYLKYLLDQNKVEEAWWSYVLGIYSIEEAQRIFYNVPLLPDHLTPDKEVSILCRHKPEKSTKSTGLSSIAGKPNYYIKQ